MFTDNFQGLIGSARLRLFHLLRLWRLYERWLDRLLAAWLAHRPGTFVDVGAHVGAILLKVKALSPATRCIAFEPNPESWSAARRLIRLSRLQDCHVLPFGLSEKPGVRALYSRDATTDSAASVVEGFRDASFYSYVQWVAVLDGDSVLRNLKLGPVSLIKVDVEGGELEALAGLRRTLASDRPGIICEVLPVYDRHGGVGKLRWARQDELQDLLVSERYKIFRIRRDGTLVPLDDLEVHSDLALCEYFFVPEEEALFFDTFDPPS